MLESLLSVTLLQNEIKIVTFHTTKFQNHGLLPTAPHHIQITQFILLVPVHMITYTEDQTTSYNYYTNLNQC